VSTRRRAWLIFLKYISDAFQGGTTPSRPSPTPTRGIATSTRPTRLLGARRAVAELQERANNPEIWQAHRPGDGRLEKANVMLKGVLPRITRGPRSTRTRLGE